MSKILPLSQMDDDLKLKAKQMAAAINSDVPMLVGEMLVEGFKKSWDLQRFNDTGSPKWAEVERRKSGSDWYGFAYKNKKNFSKRATTRNILYGSGSTNLRDSIILSSFTNRRIVISSNQPHAAVHNEGLNAKIFGRKTFQMPKRQFMGNSIFLHKKAKQIINKVIDKIL